MFRELLAIFRGANPLRSMGQKFGEMLKITEAMTLRAGRIYFGEKAEAEERTRLYKDDVKVNKLERAVRKEVLAHLALSSNTLDVPYCLLLMSLVKDVERLGDYAKNLAEAEDLRSEALPSDDLVNELAEIRREVEGTVRETGEVFESSDQERAEDLLRHGRAVAHRCDALIGRIARSDYSAAVAASTVLAARFYKRVGGHVLNILSSVVMPLHKVDYFDEDVLDKDRRAGQ